MRFDKARLPRMSGSHVAESIRNGVLVGGFIAVLLFPQHLTPRFLTGASVDAPAARADVALSPPRFAEFGAQIPSPDARHIADWVADTRDNLNHDFVIVDKKFAHVYVFDAQARLRGATPVLLGAAPGDDSVAGIGSRSIESIREDERTTPAGRFIAQLGSNAQGEDVVWIDYGAAVSMHRVRPTVASERRLERLASPTHEDNRISWGCINVPVAFFDGFVAPVFQEHNAVVYVLPEVKPVQQVFGSYDVVARHPSMAGGKAYPGAPRGKSEH